MHQFEFCYIPAGLFWLGSPNDNKVAFEDEKPLHQLDLSYSYWLGHHPVTTAQFSLFVEQSGYSLRYIHPFPVLPDSPVTNIKHEDAQAFCKWLKQQWDEQNLLPDDWQITLPNEAEWEKAAKGGLEVPVTPLIQPILDIKIWQPEIKLKANRNPFRKFPWGNRSNPKWANYKRTKLRQTTVVGSFPKGVSPYGCEDMSGNVREWTRSQFKQYPYDPMDGRENLEAKGNTEWVLRGGSFIDFSRSTRCAVRFASLSGNRNSTLGFRLAIVPASVLARGNTTD